MPDLVLHLLQWSMGCVTKACHDTGLPHVCKSITCNCIMLDVPAEGVWHLHAPACRWGSQAGAYLLNWVNGVNDVTYNVNLLAYAGDGAGEAFCMICPLPAGRPGLAVQGSCMFTLRGSQTCTHL